MNYIIEEMNLNNVYDYAKINALTWKESYQGIVDSNFLDLINKEEEIKKAVNNLKKDLNDGSKRFLLKVDDEYVGILRVRQTKYENYLDCGELGALYLLNSVKKKGYGKILFNKAVSELNNMGYHKMIIGCLQDNPSNNFYLHMGGKLINNNKFILPNNQELIENLYYYDI